MLSIQNLHQYEPHVIQQALNIQHEFINIIAIGDLSKAEDFIVATLQKDPLLFANMNTLLSEAKDLSGQSALILTVFKNAIDLVKLLLDYDIGLDQIKPALELINLATTGRRRTEASLTRLLHMRQLLLTKQLQQTQLALTDAALHPILATPAIMNQARAKASLPPLVTTMLTLAPEVTLLSTQIKELRHTKSSQNCKPLQTSPTIPNRMLTSPVRHASDPQPYIRPHYKAAIRAAMTIQPAPPSQAITATQPSHRRYQVNSASLSITPSLNLISHPPALTDVKLAN